MRVPTQPRTENEARVTMPKANQSRLIQTSRKNARKLTRRLGLGVVIPVYERTVVGRVCRFAAVHDLAQRTPHLLQAVNLVLDGGDLGLGPLADRVAAPLPGEGQFEQ